LPPTPSVRNGAIFTSEVDGSKDHSKSVSKISDEL
jgi:hypothetical protein